MQHERDQILTYCLIFLTRSRPCCIHCVKAHSGSEYFTTFLEVSSFKLSIYGDLKKSVKVADILLICLQFKVRNSFYIYNCRIFLKSSFICVQLLFWYNRCSLGGTLDEFSFPNILFLLSFEECGRYLETLKVYENKPSDSIREQMHSDYLSRVFFFAQILYTSKVTFSLLDTYRKKMKTFIEVYIYMSTSKIPLIYHKFRDVDRRKFL